MKHNQIRQVVFPILAALIWGTAFVAQDVCADTIGTFTFNAVRYFIAVLALLVLIAVLNATRKDRPQPTEAEMQKQAVALNELHEQNGVAWETVDNVLYFALNSQWWGKKVQSTYDLKRYFNEIFADMVKEQGAVKE